MNVWDCLPHKMAINRSLHKASDELRLKIDAYQVEYDRRVEKCKTELEQEEMKRNRELDKFKDSLNLELQDDQALLNEIYEDVTGYVDKYLYSKYIDKFREAKKNLYKLLQEDCNFLFEQMKDISDEIEILRGRKQVLTSFTDVRDVIDLMTLSGYEIQTDSVVDAPALIKYINSTLANSEEKQETERYSLRRLKDIVQQRADYVSVIQYIDWVIEQKILFSKQLSAKRKTIRDTMSELNAETEKLVDEKRALKHDLVVLAERVRMHWARPITYLNAEIDYSYKRRNEEVKEKNEKIKKIKGEQREKRNIGDELHRRALFHENDQFIWDRLNRDYKDLSSEIDSLSSEIDTLSSDIDHSSGTITMAKKERKDWFNKKNKICILIKNHTGFFEYGKKISVKDEYKVIESRLVEIADIRTEGKKLAEKTFNEERNGLDVDHDSVIQKLSAEEVEANERFGTAKTNLSNAEQLVLHAETQLEKCQQNDNRILLIKLFGGDTDELISAKSCLRKAKQESVDAKAALKDCEQEIESIKKKIEMENADYERKVKLCVPHYLRPTTAEMIEEKKLMLRKQNLVDQQNQEV
jgi:hypothetical protein